MLDGNAETFWHTGPPGKHFARFDFNSPLSISKVVITRRQGKIYNEKNSFYLLAQTVVPIDIKMFASFSFALLACKLRKSVRAVQQVKANPT